MDIEMSAGGIRSRGTPASCSSWHQRCERNKREISTTLARDDCGNLIPATSLLQQLYIGGKEHRSGARSFWQFCRLPK